MHPPKIQSDKSSSGRGLAIKVLNVSGTVIEEDPIGVNCQNFSDDHQPHTFRGKYQVYTIRLSKQSFLAGKDS
jgi:hypothetical protein